MPFAGWKRVDKSLVRRIDKDFERLADGDRRVARLARLGSRMVLRDAVDRHDGLRFAPETGMTIIWIAFAFELIIMTSIVRNKIAYCVGHWIDLFIVLTPFLTFMPVLRLLQLGRVASAGRLVRVYRVRGVLLRTYRGFYFWRSCGVWCKSTPRGGSEGLAERLDDQLHAVHETRREMEELERRNRRELAATQSITPAAPPPNRAAFKRTHASRPVSVVGDSGSRYPKRPRRPRGRRRGAAAYRPIVTPLCEVPPRSMSPQTLLQTTGAITIYVADLDAIEGGAIHSALSTRCSRSTSRFGSTPVRGTLLDSAPAAIDQRLRANAPSASRVVIGTETLVDRNESPRIIEVARRRSRYGEHRHARRRDDRGRSKMASRFAAFGHG